MFENLTYYDVDELCDWVAKVGDIGGKFLNRYDNSPLIENWDTDFDVSGNLTQEQVVKKIGDEGIMLCFYKGNYINLLIARQFFERNKIEVVTGHIGNDPFDMEDKSLNFLLIPRSAWPK